ncbi:bifunctional diguanylate cyclase/phosphodiesterase [Planococcus lenghuensis]|uniref:GGDEF domain-containing protein n=1 Tax=Planococcus lenghuensis TaxID=2213202 RepID=A0A1Q2L129_9BACL|nr:GGDEF domain-containing phosphodiesterase [Planococcus lenghuensis]AQQ54158.1 hypothetical protein B0X71_14285 [Planococcus lenghuensis]
MNFGSNKIKEVKSVRSFFDYTEQDDLDFFGDDTKIIFWSYESKTGEVTITGGLEKIYGFSSEDLPDDNLLKSFFGPDDKQGEDIVKQFLHAKASFDQEYRTVKKDGSEIWLKTKGKPVLDRNGDIIRINGTTRDITEKKQIEIELAESVTKYQSIVENGAQGVYISQDGKLEFANNQMVNMTGYSEKELLGMSYDQLLDEESIELVLSRVSAFLDGKENGVQEINIIRKDRSKIRVELRSSIIIYQNRPALMGTLLDVTAKTDALHMVNYLAYYDSLTGLPNRNLFYSTINKELETAKVNEQKLALLFIDLDQFKLVNDTQGHHVGDRLIQQVAAKLDELLRDRGFIARYGGDEFVSFLTYEDTAEVEAIAERIVTEVPKALSGELTVTPSVGISLFPENGEDINSLLQFADVAMYHSKRDDDRLQRYTFYHHAISSEALKGVQLTNALRKAIELNQFHLVYQPKVELGTAELKGVEALLRWNHPEHGNVSPMDFIPLAEKSGQINRIGDWVLEKAMRDMRAFEQPVLLNVNISAKQLIQENFVQNVHARLQETGFPAERLNLEITETVALYDVEKTMDKLNQLNKLGVKVSLDDFGTGYSSLSYLSKLPIDYLKVDRSFIRHLEADDTKKSIIKSIIEVAHNLNIQVVAEGIETEEQADLLHGYKCNLGQGFYFSKPLLFEDLLNYIGAGKSIAELR